MDYKHIEELRDKAMGMKRDMEKYVEMYTDIEQSTSFEDFTAKQLGEVIMLSDISSSMEAILERLRFMQKTVVAEGKLYKQDNGRYTVEGYHSELTSGATIEYVEMSGYYDKPVYVKSRIEHNGEDYYIVDMGRAEPIEGVVVRIRK